MNDEEEEFIADYHETEEAFPLVYDLGRIALEWNMVEHFFTTLIWELLGDYPTGMAVTSGMGNVSKADVVLRLSREQIKDKDTLDAIEFACKAFNILRENRNMLIHSHSIFRGKDGEKPHWRRATGKGPEGHAGVEADLSDLEDTISDICRLGVFVTSLVPFLHRKSRKNWPNRVRPEMPEKFPMPRKLSQSKASEGKAEGSTPKAAIKKSKARKMPSKI